MKMSMSRLVSGTLDLCNSSLNCVVEDTFLLLDAIEEDAEQLRQLKPLTCLEIG